MSQTDKKGGDSIIVSSTILAVAQIVVRLIGLFYRVPLIRIVGTEGMGYYGYAFEVYQFLLLLSSNGIPVAVSMLTASYLAKREYKNVQRIFKGTLIFSAIIGAFFTLIVLAGADKIAVIFFSEPNVTPALRVIAPTIFISAVLGVYRGYFQGKNSMIPTALSQIVEQIINAIISVVAAYFLIYKGPAYGAAGSTLGTFLGAASGMAFCMIIYYLYKPTIHKLLRRDKSNAKSQINYQQVIKMVVLTMAPIILSQTIYQISGVLSSTLYSKILDVLGYSGKVRADMYGIYNGEYRLILNVPMAITSSISVALIPTITRAVTLKQTEELKHRIDAIIRLTMVIAIPCCIGLMVLARPIMLLIFSDGTELPTKLMELGAFSIAFYSFSTVTISILQGIRRMKAPVINSAIAVAIHAVVIVVLLFVSDMNIYALIYGNYVFTFLMCILNLRSLTKYTGYRQEYRRTFVLPFIVSVIMGLIAFLVYKGVYFIAGSNLVAVAVTIVIAVAVYGIGIIVCGTLSEEEILSIPKGGSIIRLCKKFHIM